MSMLPSDSMEYRAVWLYGSTARGDHDELSDIDVLVVGNQSRLTSSEVEMIPGAKAPDVSHYHWSELEAMARSGSLFLHHLRQEGQPIIEYGDAHSRMREVLYRTAPYSSASRDIGAFETTIEDVSGGLAIGLSPIFELGVVGGVIRHASVLTCYLAGEPCYGRYSIRKSCYHLGLSHLAKEFQEVYRFRLHQCGRCAPPFDASADAAQLWVERLRTYLKSMRNLYARDY